MATADGAYEVGSSHIGRAEADMLGISGGGSGGGALFPPTPTHSPSPNNPVIRLTVSSRTTAPKIVGTTTGFMLVPVLELWNLTNAGKHSQRTVTWLSDLFLTKTRFYSSAGAVALIAYELFTKVTSAFHHLIFPLAVISFAATITSVLISPKQSRPYWSLALSLISLVSTFFAIYTKFTPWVSPHIYALVTLSTISLQLLMTLKRMYETADIVTKPPVTISPPGRFDLGQVSRLSPVSIPGSSHETIEVNDGGGDG